MDRDGELEMLRAMHSHAANLAQTADPLLRGQYVALLGRITALLTVVEGQLPDALETAAFGRDG
jgi:hypothetical protein